MFEEFRKDFIVPPFRLVNYINLSLEEKKMVLDARNSEEVRKWMTSTEPISFDSHLRFIENLKTSEKSFYWAVFLEKRSASGGALVERSAGGGALVERCADGDLSEERSRCAGGDSLEERCASGDSSGKRFVGGVSLVGMKNMDADSGIFMVPSCIGSGMGVQLSIVSTDFYFSKLGMRAVHSTVNRDNASALRMSALIGCKFGVETDGFIPTMLCKEDFMARRERLMKMSLIR